MARELPNRPFDGQKYIDSNNMEWEYDGDTKCWRSGASVRAIPDVSETTSGLLPPDLKALLDSVPRRGGGFGIITKPLMTLVPARRDILLKVTAKRGQAEAAGSSLLVNEVMVADSYAGKVLFCTSGLLRSRAFLIFSNSTNELHVDGTAVAQAKNGDKFEIISPSYMNSDGVIFGDITIKSYSLDFSCIDNTGAELENCGDGCVGSDEIQTGIDMKISERFLGEFCVTIPGQPGPQGDKGLKGPKGADGTGDGPQGETGDAGQNAPSTPSTLGAIRVQDIDDVYDTAVVGLELDAAAGKLYVIRGKVRTPSADRPAKQVMASAISREISFTNGFDYEIVMPETDPIGTSDVSIIHYPRHYELSEKGAVAETDLVHTKLSKLVEAMASKAQTKIDEISAAWDQEIKPFIEGKDEEARKELYSLADQVARCEFGLGVEYCLGLFPTECKPEEDPPAEQFPRAPEILGPEWEGAIAAPAGNIDVSPSLPGGGGGGGGDDDGGQIPRLPKRDPQEPPPPDHQYNIRSPLRDSEGKSMALPDPGGLPWSDWSAERYKTGSIEEPSVAPTIKVNNSADIPTGALVVEYAGGAARTKESTFTAAVKFTVKDDTGTREVTLEEPEAAQINNWDADAFMESMKQNASPVVIPITGKGRVTASMPIDGTGHTGSISLKVKHITHPDNLGNAPIPVAMVAQRDKNGNIVSGDGGGGGGGDVSLDCGDVQCPDCGDACVYVASITPSTVYPGQTSSVTLSGSNFGETNAPTVSVGGSTATVTSFSNTTIVCTIPATVDQETPYDVEVNNHDSSIAVTIPNGIYCYMPRPLVTDLSAATFNRAATTDCVITVTDFGDSPSVYLTGPAGHGPLTPTSTTASTMTVVLGSSTVPWTAGDYDMQIVRSENTNYPTVCPFAIRMV